jgi:Uma2 family endonuclease
MRLTEAVEIVCTGEPCLPVKNTRSIAKKRRSLYTQTAAAVNKYSPAARALPFLGREDVYRIGGRSPSEESGTKKEIKKSMSAALDRYSFTAEEFERMGEAGIFRPGARLELIEGEIFEMSPIGNDHAASVKFLNRLLSRLFDGIHVIGVQDPVRLSDFSEPQPDISLLRWRDDDYREGHPTPADVLLLVEVADTTVVADRKVKIPLYARAGIAEAWLVNIPEERVEIYSDPAEGSYRRAEVFGRGEEARSHTVEGLAVKVSELLG